MPLSKGSLGCLSDHGKSFFKEALKGRPCGQAGSKFIGLGGQGRVIQRFKRRLEGVNRRHPRLQSF
jgi:hypothetical protein